MLHQFLHNRSIAGSSSISRLQASSGSADLSFILPKFKNFSTDEYSTMDNDGMSVPPLACSFAKMVQHQHVVAVVDEDGYLVLYNIHKTGRAAVIKTWQVHSNAVFDLEWLQEENKILTGSGDQTVALYDVETCQKLETFRGHASSIKSVSSRVGDDAVFVSGSRDGHIMVWDKRIFHKDGAIPPVDTIHNAHMLQSSSATQSKARKKRQPNPVKDAQQSVTAVLFQNENYLISAGAVDGCLKVWDVRKTYRVRASGAAPIHVFQYSGTNSRKHGYSSLVQDSQGLRLFASCTDDVIYQYDMASYNPQPVQTWRGHKNSTFYVKAALSPDDQYLLSGSSDELAYIWEVNKPKAAPVVLKSHTAEVTSVSWCPNDLTKLVTLSDDTKTKFWRVYCRELDKEKLPQWFGRACKVSKERATSTVSDVQTPKASSTPAASFTPSTVSALKSLKISRPSPSPSPQPCIKHWLKRKEQSGQVTDGQTSQPVRLLQGDSNAAKTCDSSSQEMKEPSENNNSAHSIASSDICPETGSKCKPSREVSANDETCSDDKSFTKKKSFQRSNSTGNAEQISAKSEESSSLPSPVTPRGRKRSHEESESLSTPESPVTPLTPCMKCINNGTKSRILSADFNSLEKKSRENLDSCTKESDQIQEQVNVNKGDKNLSLQHREQSVYENKSPQKGMLSPSKIKKAVKQDENAENKPETPVKRRLSSDGSSPRSPKRPCLTSIESNNSTPDRCSVRVTLFADAVSVTNILRSGDTTGEKQADQEVQPVQNSSVVEKTKKDVSDSFSTEMSKEKEDLSKASSSQTQRSDRQICTKKSPTKSAQRSEKLDTPSKNIPACQVQDDDDFNSPTRNLPNLVLDEIYGRKRTPRSVTHPQTQKLDWLTQLAQEKMKKSSEGSQKQTMSGKSSPKVVKGLAKISQYFKQKDGNS